jgi:hypothetical protein
LIFGNDVLGQENTEKKKRRKEEKKERKKETEREAELTLARAANCKVLSVSPKLSPAGLTHAMIYVKELPPKESFNR